jgi:hypothetical protein
MEKIKQSPESLADNFLINWKLSNNDDIHSDRMIRLGDILKNRVFNITRPGIIIGCILEGFVVLLGDNNFRQNINIDSPILFFTIKSKRNLVEEDEECSYPYEEVKSADNLSLAFEDGLDVELRKFYCEDYTDEEFKRFLGKLSLNIRNYVCTFLVE